MVPTVLNFNALFELKNAPEADGVQGVSTVQSFRKLIDGRIQMARDHFDLSDQQIIEALAEQLSTLYYFAVLDGESNFLKAV